MTHESPEQTGVIEYKGKKIIFIDLAKCQPRDIISRTEKVKDIIRSSPPNSVLMLTDFSFMRYDNKTTNYAKNYIKDNKPYVKKSAFLGVEGIKKIIFHAAIRFSGRYNMRLFNNKEEALDWLAEE